MNILDYIKGQRKGKEAHRLEKEAMSDPFLSDALEGFDTVQGNHAKRIEELRSRLPRPEKQQTNYLRIAGIAAGILLFVGIGCVAFLYNKAEPNRRLVAQSEQKEEREQIVELTPPEELEETKELAPPVIADKNVVSTDSKEDMSATTDIFDESAVEIRTEPSVRAKATPRALPVIGADKFTQYLQDSIRYPADSLCIDIKGKVILAFMIDTQGRPYDISVKQPLCPSADQEAVRLIKEGPDWALSNQQIEWTIVF